MQVGAKAVAYLGKGVNFHHCLAPGRIGQSPNVGHGAGGVVFTHSQEHGGQIGIFGDQARVVAGMLSVILGAVQGQTTSRSALI